MLRLHVLQPPSIRTNFLELLLFHFFFDHRILFAYTLVKIQYDICNSKKYVLNYSLRFLFSSLIINSPFCNLCIVTCRLHYIIPQKRKLLNGKPLLNHRTIRWFSFYNKKTTGLAGGFLLFSFLFSFFFGWGFFGCLHSFGYA